VSVNRSMPVNAAAAKNGPSGSAYVTYFRPEDALRCIEAVDGQVWEGEHPACQHTPAHLSTPRHKLTHVSAQASNPQHNPARAHMSLLQLLLLGLQRTARSDVEALPCNADMHCKQYMQAAAIG
jgi:hypothetical protein